MRRPESTFDEAFPALLSIAHRAAFRVLGNTTEAEDVAVEILARAYVRWDRIERYCQPWVAKSAANLAIDQTRRKPLPPLAPRTSTPVDIEVVERRAAVDALAALPRRQREVIVLVVLCDFSIADAAESLGISVGSAKQHSSRGLAALRRAHQPEPQLSNSEESWTRSK